MCGVLLIGLELEANDLKDDLREYLCFLLSVNIVDVIKVGVSC